MRPKFNLFKFDVGDFSFFAIYIFFALFFYYFQSVSICDSPRDDCFLLYLRQTISIACCSELVRCVLLARRRRWECHLRLESLLQHRTGSLVSYRIRHKNVDRKVHVTMTLNVTKIQPEKVVRQQSGHATRDRHKVLRGSQLRTRLCGMQRIQTESQCWEREREKTQNPTARARPYKARGLFILAAERLNVVKNANESKSHCWLWLCVRSDWRELIHETWDGRLQLRSGSSRWHTFAGFAGGCKKKSRPMKEAASDNIFFVVVLASLRSFDFFFVSFLCA